MRARAVDTPWGPGDRLKVVATVLSGLFSLFPSIRIVFIITATCQQCLLITEKIKTTGQRKAGRRGCWRYRLRRGEAPGAAERGGSGKEGTGGRDGAGGAPGMEEGSSSEEAWETEAGQGSRWKWRGGTESVWEERRGTRLLEMEPELEVGQEEPGAPLGL